MQKVYFNMFEWCNEESRITLERKYLLPSETVKDACWGIASHAADLLGDVMEPKAKIREKIYELLAKGWIAPSSPIWANFRSNRGSGIACVTGDTWINTKIGGGKQARDINIGDEVLTHKGRYRKVVNVIPTKNRGDIYKLKVTNRMTPLYLTGDHLVLTNIGWVRADNLDTTKHLIAINDKIDLESEDYTIDLSEISKEHKNATEINGVAIDEDLAWALGLWFAEGSLMKNNGNFSGIRITLSQDEEQDAKTWLEIMSSKFGLNGKIYFSQNTRNNKTAKWLTVNLHSSVLGAFFSSFGIGCKVKEIPQWIINLPISKLHKFLDGMLQGDGSKKEHGSNRITLANPKLLLQLYQIGLKLELDMSLQMQEKAGKLASTSHVYTLLFTKYHQSSNRFKHSAIKFNDGLAYSPIRTIEKTDKMEDVYDFTVDEDHSFSASGVVLHNCFGSYISDTMNSILDTVKEVGHMTKVGGGTSAYFGNLRPKGSPLSVGGYSNGPISFMQMFDTTIRVVSQQNIRRGSMAAYMPVDHPDIMDFLKIKSTGHPIQDLSSGVCITDKWMQEMLDGDKGKREVWLEILRSRKEKGYPYLFFTDAVNRNKPDVYKDKGLDITHSNLCAEIALANTPDKSFVCCLCAMNLEKYDEWKDTDAVKYTVMLLEAVMEDFIRKNTGKAGMERAVKFAIEERALGLGATGWHSYLQSKMIPFDSLPARYHTMEIFENISKKALEASKELAKYYGEPELLKGYGRRHSTLMAIAPNTSSSEIMGQCSQGIEPNRSNYFVFDTEGRQFARKNKYLEKLLEFKGKNDFETWANILDNLGSVQHLDFLTKEEKNVFKTFWEVDQYEILRQSRIRQDYIDQSTSLNLFMPPDATAKDLHELHIYAWKQGLKGLYYLRSEHPLNWSKVRQLETCSSCSG